MDWLSFFLGILADEATRRLLLPFLSRNRERIPLARYVVHTTRGGMYGCAPAPRAAHAVAAKLCGELVGDLEAGRLGPIDPRCRAALRRHLEWHRRNKHKSDPPGYPALAPRAA